jgi:[pyruvate, water dikinase]-phosphate phosphotransferase / [pyruvate, water dikinase] kinase
VPPSPRRGTGRSSRGGGSRKRKTAPTGPQDAGPRLLYLLSDSTGNLGRHMLTAFLTQFPAGTFDVRARNFLDSPQKVEAALSEAGAAPGVVMHALVDPGAKRLVRERCTRLGLPHCDLTGNFVEFLSQASGVAPVPDRRRLHDVGEAYRRRVKAIEFTLEHDDGLGIDTMHDADVVLVGVSRTSKTPTCIYLAQQGVKAGNVSLAVQVEPPAQLLGLPKSKVAALVIDPSQLARIRSRRQAAWHMPDTAYNEADTVEAEVAWSRRLFARHGWSTFDVTNQAIEETAARIMERLRLSVQPAGDGAVSHG